MYYDAQDRQGTYTQPGQQNGYSAGLPRNTNTNDRQDSYIANLPRNTDTTVRQDGYITNLPRNNDTVTIDRQNGYITNPPRNTDTSTRQDGYITIPTRNINPAVQQGGNIPNSSRNTSLTDDDTYIYPSGCTLKNCSLHPEKHRHSSQNYPERTVDNIQITSRATSVPEDYQVSRYTQSNQTSRDSSVEPSKSSKKKKKKDRYDKPHKHGKHKHTDIKPPRHIELGALRYLRESKKQYMKRNGLDKKSKKKRSQRDRESQTEDDNPDTNKLGKKEKYLTSDCGVAQLAHSTEYIPRKKGEERERLDSFNELDETTNDYDQLNPSQPPTPANQNNYPTGQDRKDPFFRPTNAQADQNPDRTIHGFINPKTGSYYPLPQSLNRAASISPQSPTTPPSHKDPFSPSERDRISTLDRDRFTPSERDQLSPSQQGSFISEELEWRPDVSESEHQKSRGKGQDRDKGPSDNEPPVEDIQEDQKNKKSCCTIS